jgi:hypothetical protein
VYDKNLKHRRGSIPLLSFPIHLYGPAWISAFKGVPLMVKVVLSMNLWAQPTKETYSERA